MFCIGEIRHTELGVEWSPLVVPSCTAVSHCALYSAIKDHTVHGSHFFGVTNFPDISSTFFHFPVLFKVYCLFKVWRPISNGFLLFWLTNFQYFSIFQAQKFPGFPVLWVKFPEFSSLIKIPWLFNGVQFFPVRVGTVLLATIVFFAGGDQFPIWWQQGRVQDFPLEGGRAPTLFGGGGTNHRCRHFLAKCT